MKTVRVPAGALPGDVIELLPDAIGSSKTGNVHEAVLVKDFSKASKYIVAVPEGINPGDTFLVGPTLSSQDIKKVHTEGVGGRLLDAKLKLCRSMIIQEVKNVFEFRRSPSKLEKCVRHCCSSACLHLCCGSWMHCSQAPPREFLVSDGDASEATFLFVVKEVSNRSMRERCNPNHSLTLEAFHVIDEIQDDGLKRVIRPDLNKGPIFEVERQGQWCLSCCSCGIKECHHKFVVRHSSNMHAEAASYYGAQIIGENDRTMIGRGLQTCCGGSCCTPTLAVMRRDEIVTESGIGLTDTKFAYLEGPCCCTGGPLSSCSKRNKYWYMSRTKGKAYDIASISSVRNWRLPSDLSHIFLGEPIMVSIRKRDGMTPSEKKLTLGTLLIRDYMFMRHSSCVFCCSCHCLGGNCTV